MRHDPIAEMLARQQIAHQLHTYCRAVDRIDQALGYTVWHADGQADYGTFVGTGHGFIDWVCGVHRTLRGHSHKVSNMLIEVDGEEAASESYVTAWIVRPGSDDGSDLLRTIHGRYLDRWSRRGGRWAIDDRRFIYDFAYQEPMTVELGAETRRDPGDISYNLFRDIAHRTPAG